MELADRLAAVRDRIAAAAARAGRTADEVKLIAVSKTFGADVIREAAGAGLEDFGENRAQELKQKLAVLGDAVRWHFIGPLQTNKVKLVAGRVALIHSVDRLALAEEIGRRARGLGVVQDVLLEVNVSGEATKHGIEPQRVPGLAEQIQTLDGIALRGVMTMPPRTDDPEESRSYFKELASIRDRLRNEIPDAQELSMGMTQDFEVAIEEGATIVRVGEAIFGPRR